MAADLKEFELPLDGVFRSEIRKSMVEEFTKLMLYQKKMIPLQYDLLKRDLESKTVAATSDTDGIKVRNKHSSSLAEKKKAQFVDAVKKLFYFLDEAFILGGPVKQVLFVIGSNIITCKESYSVVFPIAFYEGSVLTAHECKSALFRHLVTSDVFTENDKAAGEILIYLQAPKNCSVCTQHFDPKPHLKLPTKGNHYSWRYVSTTAKADHSYLGDREFNISGIEPLNTSVDDSAKATQVGRFTENDLDHMSDLKECDRPSIVTNSEVSVMQEDEVEDNYIWYQIPLHIKKLKF